MPRPHGVALFTRGETQAMVFTTLGGAGDEQTIDALTERVSKRFYLHYNFPPFSVGEARMQRGPGRREVGHGTLAERALSAVLPERRTSRTRSGSSPRRSSPTARRRWRRSAAPRWP